MLLYDYYDSWISISVITISYGIATVPLIQLSLLFLSWYKTGHSLIAFLYFASMVTIAFNLVMTAVLVDAKVSDRPDQIGVYVGSSGDISFGRYMSLDTIYRISSLVSFLGIWITTAILMTSYREKAINAAILSIPLIYFIVTYFYQFFLSRALFAYIELDPLSAAIILSAFLSLSKPIGGLIFGAAFWKIAKLISYEKNMKTYMIITGWGILFIFTANQAATQVIGPYPPFGLATVTVLTTSSYLMLLGIYHSASLVSANNTLRKSIRKHALESRLLDIIGR